MDAGPAGIGKGDFWFIYRCDRDIYFDNILFCFGLGFGFVLRFFILFSIGFALRPVTFGCIQIHDCEYRLD